MPQTGDITAQAATQTDAGHLMGAGEERERKKDKHREIER